MMRTPFTSLGVLEQALDLGGGHLGLDVVQLLVQGLVLGHDGLGAAGQVGQVIGLEGGSGAAQHQLVGVGPHQQVLAGDSLDAADACGHRRLADES